MASWPETKMASGRGCCQMLSSGSFWLPDGLGIWLSIWRLAPNVWSSESLDLVAIDMIVVAMN